MLTRTRKKEYYYDKFHRGFVNVCMTITIATGAMLLYSAATYFMYTLPERKLKIQEQEKELLSEGMDLENVPST